MLQYISKKRFENNLQVRTAIYDVLDHFENHILYDISQNTYVTINKLNNTLYLDVI